MLKKQDILIPANYKKYASIVHDSDIIPKSSILYFHGGGLLYGQRNDLPDYHLEKFTKAGYIVLAFDYPLSPAAKIEQIIDDCLASIDFFINNIEKICSSICSTPLKLNYFLFGRSAGGYLVTLLSSKLKDYQVKHLRGIISYYGYGILEDAWYEYPSQYYNKLPKIKLDLDKYLNESTSNSSLQERYQLYVYARQNGLWKKLIYEGRDKFFYLDYSLRLVHKLPKPLFIAHSSGDPDVPFKEFIHLSNKYRPKTYIANSPEHDFDRNTNSFFTKELIANTIEFADDLMK